MGSAALTWGENEHFPISRMEGHSTDTKWNCEPWMQDGSIKEWAEERRGIEWGMKRLSNWSCCEAEDKFDCPVLRDQVFYCASWYPLIMWQNHSNSFWYGTQARIWWSLEWFLWRHAEKLTLQNADCILMPGYLYTFIINNNTNITSIFAFFHSSCFVTLEFWVNNICITEKNMYSRMN